MLTGRGGRRDEQKKGLLTWALFFHKVTGTEEFTVDGDGLLLDPKLAGFLIRHGIHLHFVSRDP